MAVTSVAGCHGSLRWPWPFSRCRAAFWAQLLVDEVWRRWRAVVLRHLRILRKCLLLSAHCDKLDIFMVAICCDGCRLTFWLTFVPLSKCLEYIDNLIPRGLFFFSLVGSISSHCGRYPQYPQFWWVKRPDFVQLFHQKSRNPCHRSSTATAAIAFGSPGNSDPERCWGGGLWCPINDTISREKHVLQYIYTVTIPDAYRQSPNEWSINNSVYIYIYIILPVPCMGAGWSNIGYNGMHNWLGILRFTWKHQIPPRLDRWRSVVSVIKAGGSNMFQHVLTDPAEFWPTVSKTR